MKYVYLIIFAVFCAGAAYVYALRADLAVSEQNNMQLNSVVSQQEETISKLESLYKEVVDIRSNLYKEVRMQSRHIDAVIREMKSDQLGAKTEKNLESYQKKINETFAEYTKCLEDISNRQQSQACARFLPDARQ